MDMRGKIFGLVGVQSWDLIVVAVVVVTIVVVAIVRVY